MNNPDTLRKYAPLAAVLAFTVSVIAVSLLRPQAVPVKVVAPVVPPPSVQLSNGDPNCGEIVTLKPERIKVGR